MERSERGGGREICNATREEETSPDVVGGVDWRTLFLFCVYCMQGDLPNPDHHFTFFIRLIFRFVNLCEFPQGLSKLHHSTCRLNGGEA